MRTPSIDSYCQNFNSIKSVDDLKLYFPDAEANLDNWCLFSTSGTHGTYIALDDIERYFSDSKRFIKEENGGEAYSPNLTVLVIRPRLVSMLYGHVTILQEDIPYLKQLASSSLKNIVKSQSGNIDMFESERNTTNLIYEMSLLQLRLDNAKQMIRAHEAMNNPGRENKAYY